ncbi:molybdopterin-dependent oxidoreductase [Leucobacter sp. GX24907]
MTRTHLTHFGVLEAESDGTSIRTRPWAQDPDPRRIIDNVASSQHHPARVLRPAVRRGYLEHGPGRTDLPREGGAGTGTSAAGRGDDTFVEVSWDEALDLVADELARVYGPEGRGSAAVYGESYGWSSAGRFHHGKSQVHRFLNSLGGYVYGVGDYSYGTSRILLPHIIGFGTPELVDRATSWQVVADHTELFVAFGGLSEKNTAISSGGIGNHYSREFVERARANGCTFVDVTPIRDDTFGVADAEWIAPLPGSDVALMLAIAHVLDDEGIVDTHFIEHYTTGYDRFIAYVRGATDGTPKTPEWAELITTVPGERIRDLAQRMGRSRTMINLSWSMQRQHHGEQPIWAGIALAAMLGQIGLPGGGFSHGYGSSAQAGNPRRLVGPPSLPQGQNPEPRFIPVSRISDMLLSPSTVLPFNGQEIELPDIELVYWVGGNPFHHQQDLPRLRRAFQRPSTIVVHEQFWTATARHADIVLPATMTVERDDFGSGRGDPLFFPMPALTRPAGEARDDYAIFSELERRLDGRVDAQFSFSEGRSSAEWLRRLYTGWADRMADHGSPVPEFDAFWQREFLEIPAADREQVLLSEFRADPSAHPLTTPSGRIELFSERIADFGYDDCPGHPTWMEPREWLGDANRRFPLQLIANQPKTRLHSQFDVGSTSLDSKVDGREPVRMHPEDAAARGLRDGDVVRIFNDRGSCLAGLVVSEALSRGIVQLATGAWYDPDPADPSFCRHGNPNVLCSDLPSSQLAQGTTGQHALVEVTRWEHPVPPLAVLVPPEFSERWS